MKTHSHKIDPLTKEEYIEVNIKGQRIMNNPLLNKGLAFSFAERMNLGLDGFLRERELSIEEQVERTYAMYVQKPNDLEKYIFLQAVLNRNETIFYNMLRKYLKEMLPIVYTPTVGQACLSMSHILRKFRGIYLSPYNIRNIDTIFQNLELPEVHLIVVTDGERILGLGDLGSDGMGIPVGKINLYVAAGGLNPATCLPISLDVGTNNERLLKDPGYLGVKKPRLSGSEYDDFLEKFVLGVKRNFPNALLQWEDFAKHKAFTLMERYRKRILSFNDDIQGTGATALSALYSAMKIKKSKFQNERFVVVGMGQAGAGVCYNLYNALLQEGLNDDEIRRHIFAVDVNGLIVDDMDSIETQMVGFAQKREDIKDWNVKNPDNINLKEVVENSQATVLVGVTAKAGLFDDEILAMMAEHTERPVLFALSNPTANSECTPDNVYKHTKGKGLMATGSPFAPIEGEYGTMFISQSNNMYIFPGVGLGALISRTPYITHKMFLAASSALSDLVTDEELSVGKLLPDLNNVLEISAHIALAVAKEARDSGLGKRVSDDRLEEQIRKAQWDGRYYPYRPGSLSL
jgi:malate dehydrogenase (oxaloacetate-decarboxylating)